MNNILNHCLNWLFLQVYQSRDLWHLPSKSLGRNRIVWKMNKMIFDLHSSSAHYKVVSKDCGEQKKKKEKMSGKNFPVKLKHTHTYCTSFGYYDGWCGIDNCDVDIRGRVSDDNFTIGLREIVLCEVPFIYFSFYLAFSVQRSRLKVKNKNHNNSYFSFSWNCGAAYQLSSFSSFILYPAIRNS